MLLIPCPYCGPRPELEFKHGGEAHVIRDPSLADDAAWGAFKATPGSGNVFAHQVATGEPHRINAPFALDRFTTGRLIDEAAAAAVAH